MPTDRDGLKSLLDEMLTDAGEQHRLAQTRERVEPEPEAPVNAFADVEQFRALPDAELCKVLAAAARDDVLTVLSGASDALRRKVLNNLSRDSVRWLQQNLEYFDTPTRALLSAGRGQLVQVANKLLADGSVALPAAGATEPARDTLDDQTERLGAILVDLLARARKSGPAGLADVVSAGGDPMLTEGVALVAQGADETAAAAAMDAARVVLLEAYTRRLALIREGVVALARGEDPDAFRRRLETIVRGAARAR